MKALRSVRATYLQITSTGSHMTFGRQKEGRKEGRAVFFYGLLRPGLLLDEPVPSLWSRGNVAAGPKLVPGLFAGSLKYKANVMKSREQLSPSSCVIFNCFNFINWNDVKEQQCHLLKLREGASCVRINSVVAFHSNTLIQSEYYCFSVFQGKSEA